MLQQSYITPAPPKKRPNMQTGLDETLKCDLRNIFFRRFLKKSAPPPVRVIYNRDHGCPVFSLYTPPESESGSSSNLTDHEETEPLNDRNEEAVASGGGRVDEASTVNELASDQAKKTPIVKEPHKTSFAALAGTSNAL